jgi:glycosyltransferase involved in cell wall biosynthesis
MPHAPHARVVVAGNDEEGYTDTLRRRASRLGVEGRIAFVGPVHGDAKWHLIRHARSLILPSYSENFGNVVLEALAHEIPVIVTPEVGLSAMVEQTGAGIVAAGSPAVLGAAIAELLQNPLKAAEMGRRGRAAVLDNYTWDAIARNMVGRYRAVLSSHPHKPGLAAS